MIMIREYHEDKVNIKLADKKEKVGKLINDLISLTDDKGIIYRLKSVEFDIFRDKHIKKYPKSSESEKKEAMTAQTQRDKSRVTAYQHFMNWSEEDDNFIMQSHEADFEIAKIIGRTLSSVRTRKQHLRGLAK
jgi:hypothetical protein